MPKLAMQSRTENNCNNSIFKLYLPINNLRILTAAGKTVRMFNAEG